MQNKFSIYEAIMNNNTLTVIAHRRSIRKYKSEQISDEEIEAIMNAAVYAPSGQNLQGSHFSVIQNRELILKMRESMKNNMRATGVEAQIARANDPAFIPFFDAPAVVMISAEFGSRFAQIDGGIAAENITLAAESMNIGSCIMTSSMMVFAGANADELKEAMGMPEGYEHVCAIPLGYKDEDPEAKERKSGTVNYVK
jgi:nitroreductase